MMPVPEMSRLVANDADGVGRCRGSDCAGMGLCQDGTMTDRKSIAAAASLISSYVRHTPVLQADLGTGSPVTLKLELLQHAGSFKPRGAFNRLLSAGRPPAGVIAASGGNHGAAVAYAAKILGMTAE